MLRQAQPFVSNRGGGQMVEVRLEDDDRIEWAIKAFKRKVQKAGVLKDLKKKGRYMKPSEARQLKAQAARRRKRNPKNER
jgi:small subunit ribosomal protein S21